VNEFCATSLLDYEGELVFVTSKEAKNVTRAEAASYILGYTIGNDLSCRMFQLAKNSGGQFFFAKAFDKFAPLGPVLISQKQYEATARGRKLTTRVNGEVVQDVELAKDMIFSAEQILSHMSQGEPANDRNISRRCLESLLNAGLLRYDHPGRHGHHDGHACWRWGIPQSQIVLE
jgi:2-keto-4-pentenoate hydratase/2-oxohepta-3-ene-1,7-dioic acid hydratase in catechol pathway